MGDTIAPHGWETAEFMRNPVALWAHAADAPPIGRASNLGVEGARLMGDIEFADPTTYEFADVIYRLVVGGFVNAVSVGFLPIEYSFVENDPDRGFGIDFKRQELLEVSVVPVPANANALAEAQAKGIDLRPLGRWAERAIERGIATVSRADLVRIAQQAKASAPVSFANARRDRDFRRAEQIRLRVDALRRDQSPAAQLARAKALQARLSREPDWSAWLEHDEELRRRDRLAALDAVAMLSW